MEKTRTNDIKHECTICKDLFIPSRSYIWQCSDQCRIKACICIENGCWINKCSKTRYGTFKYKNKTMGMHRASYLIFKGEIEKNKDICHSCDNRKCCNPEHLFEGTRSQNMQDCLIKGRMSIGGKHYIAKLNDQNIKEIRDMKEFKPWMTYREISEIYGVSYATIYDIIKFRTWKHI